jgi:hypothetical protein
MTAARLNLDDFGVKALVDVAFGFVTEFIKEDVDVPEAVLVCGRPLLREPSYRFIPDGGSLLGYRRGHQCLVLEEGGARAMAM